ncbi:MAG: 30S ribosomal protein S2 [Opitutaceae bacterium]|nr:30S ribosomal protein S2 [Opitutaceae bacterium]
MEVTLRDLFDAGVHFGHQVKRWNPRSKGFVFDHRQGTSIIDLSKTCTALESACQFIEETVANGKEILLVGTKRQAQEIIRETAGMVNMPFCSNRWMGGTLTNFATIKGSVAKFKKYQAMEADGSLSKYSKKEESAIKREMSRMMRNFEGLVNMPELPSAIFIVDIKHEDIAVAEATRMNIPVVGLVDTNSDPALVNYAVPGNDDAVKAIRIIVDTIGEAIQAGLSRRDEVRQAKAAADLSTVASQPDLSAKEKTKEEPVAVVEEAPAEKAPVAPVAETAAPAEEKAPEAPVEEAAATEEVKAEEEAAPEATEEVKPEEETKSE